MKHMKKFIFILFLVSCSNQENKFPKKLPKTFTYIHKENPESFFSKFIKKDIIQEQTDFFKQNYNLPNLSLKQRREIKIAIIDTGLRKELIHQLKSKIYNPEKIKNFSGYDLTNTGMNDQLLHGTNISGIILGINQEVKILPIKYYSSLFKGNSLNNEVEAIKLAIKSKVDIINLSIAGPDFSKKEKEAILEAEKAGIIIVASTGNDGINIDKSPIYPASLKTKNMIIVSNFDKELNSLDPKSSWSNDSNLVITHGAKLIGFGVKMSGVSQAVGVVSGLISLYLSTQDKNSTRDVHKFLKSISNSSNQSLVIDFEKLKILEKNNQSTPSLKSIERNLASK